MCACNARVRAEWVLSCVLWLPFFKGKACFLEKLVNGMLSRKTALAKCRPSPWLGLGWVCILYMHFWVALCVSSCNGTLRCTAWCSSLQQVPQFFATVAVVHGCNQKRMLCRNCHGSCRGTEEAEAQQVSDPSLHTMLAELTAVDGPQTQTSSLQRNGLGASARVRVNLCQHACVSSVCVSVCKCTWMHGSRTVLFDLLASIASSSNFKLKAERLHF